MSQQPFNDMPGRPNCTFCSLGGLSDVDKLSTLFREKNLDSSDPNSGLSIEAMDHLLRQWGLRNENTPPHQFFPGSAAEWEAAREKVAQDSGHGKPRSTFPFQDQAKKFMEASSANTFAVIMEFFHDGEFHAHALLAGRRDDGSIVYIDLQTVPPSIHDNLDPHCHSVQVIPTDVDWRRNRQLSNVVENGVHQPVLMAEPFNPDAFFGDLPEALPPSPNRGDGAPSPPMESFDMDDLF